MSKYRKIFDQLVQLAGDFGQDVILGTKSDRWEPSEDRIYIRASDPIRIRIFSLAHEIGHVVIWETSPEWVRRKMDSRVGIWELEGEVRAWYEAEVILAGIWPDYYSTAFVEDRIKALGQYFLKGRIKWGDLKVCRITWKKAKLSTIKIGFRY